MNFQGHFLSDMIVFTSIIILLGELACQLGAFLAGIF